MTDNKPSSQEVVGGLEGAMLALDGEATVEQRLELVWSAYEADTGNTLHRPPAPSSRLAVSDWVRNLRGDGAFMSLNRRPPRLSPAVHRSVPEMANSLTQLGCAVHRGEDAPSAPYSVLIPIDVEPWSAQSRRDKVAIRRAVEKHLAERKYALLPWGTSPLCVTITAIVSDRSKRKDVDNLAKGLIDSMAGYLFVNDKQIQCLTLRRMEYAGDHGYYLVRAMPVHPWNQTVVFDDPTPPIILSGAVGEQS